MALLEIFRGKRVSYAGTGYTIAGITGEYLSLQCERDKGLIIGCPKNSELLREPEAELWDGNKKESKQSVVEVMK